MGPNIPIRNSVSLHHGSPQCIYTASWSRNVTGSLVIGWVAHQSLPIAEMTVKAARKEVVYCNGSFSIIFHPTASQPSQYSLDASQGNLADSAADAEDVPPLSWPAVLSSVVTSATALSIVLVVLSVVSGIIGAILRFVLWYWSEEEAKMAIKDCTRGVKDCCRRGTKCCRKSNRHAN